MVIYDIQGSLKDRIIEILLEKLGSRIEMWEAEEAADEIIEEIIG